MAKNNLIALTFLILFYIVSFPIITELTLYFEEKYSIFSVLTLLLTTFITIAIYFGFGFFILNDTGNVWSNLLSVIGVSTIILFCTLVGLVSNGLQGGRIITIANIHFYPIVMLISNNFLERTGEWIFIITSLIPSFAMWIGIISKTNK